MRAEVESRPGQAPDVSAATGAASVSVAVFAYNEEASIAACLAALSGGLGAESPPAAALTVHVLMNGCTDRTAEVVAAHRPRGFRLVPVSIARGDKANAWNTYVHEIAPEGADLHVFTDGDVTVAPGSIGAMLRRLAAEPGALGVAAVPLSGRNRESFRAKIVDQREMAGNLYGLAGAAVAELRRRGIRLPVGLFGEDGLVTTLVRYGFDTRGGARDDRRVAVAEGAGFRFASLSPWRPGDWRIYRNRRLRYAVRWQQARMLYPLLFERGAEAMPAHVLDLYRERFALTPSEPWPGRYPVFDWLARRRVAQALRAGEAARDRPEAHRYS